MRPFYKPLAALGAAALPMMFTGCHLPSAQREGQIVRRGPGQQDVSMVSDSNRDMQNAIDKARQTAPDFIAVLQKPQPTQERFTVKMRVTDGKAGEHMWLKNLTYDGSLFHGQLVDDPFEVKGYHMGQNVSVAPSEISDWIYYDKGIRQGGYTQKVIDAMEKGAGGS